jgi:hypothetical protein
VDKFMTAPEFLLGHVHDPDKLQQLAERVRASSEAPERLAAMAKLRLALLAEAESILIRDEFPIIPLYFYVISGLVKPNVRGFYPKLTGSDGSSRDNLRDMHPLRDIYLSKGGK